MSDEKEVGVLLPKALDLTPLGGISFKEHLAVGSILTVDEGSVTSKRIPLDQLKAKAVDEVSRGVIMPIDKKDSYYLCH